MRRAARSVLGLAGAAVVLAGCGPTPPQAPLPAAMKLDTALSGIANACGLAYQTTAMGAEAGRQSLAPLEGGAIKQSDKLASVYAQNPEWIYQGATIRSIVADSVSLLGDCGLERAQAELRRRTGRL